jgi:exodeoxyribonuclease III
VDAQNGAKFTCNDYTCGMPMHGFTDVWRHKYRAALEYIWFSRSRDGTRQGFRIDHAFASAPMLRRIRECSYSHSDREEGISDHSELLLRVH